MGSVISYTKPDEKEVEESAPLLSTSEKQSRFGVFLPLSYSLNDRNDKHVVVGVMGDDSYSTCVSFTAPQKRVVLSYHLWNTLRLHFDQIRYALDKRTKMSCMLKDITEASPSIIVVKPIFGKWYVQVYDEKDNRLSLTASEWGRFEQYIPCIARYILGLWRDENEIVKIIEKPEIKTNNMWWGDRLFDEVSAYNYINKSRKVSEEQ